MPTSQQDKIKGETRKSKPSRQNRIKRETLNLRIKPEWRELISLAAEVLGKNRTAFVLDAARVAAEDALLDRTIIFLKPQAYAEFLARLDAPPQPNVRLRHTLQTLAPWEK